jgi:hypothetical protein
MRSRDSKGGRRQFWLEHIEAARRSGQTLKQYAKAHGLAVSSLYNAASVARRTKRKPAIVAASAFVPVRMEPAAAPIRCRLQHAAGWQLEMERLPDPKWLRELLGEGSGDAAP